MFVMARPNSEQRKQPETVPIHAANTMMTNDTLLYVVISTDPSIKIAQQYDLVISLCCKSDLSHHQESQSLSA